MCLMDWKRGKIERKWIGQEAQEKPQVRGGDESFASEMGKGKTYC